MYILSYGLPLNMNSKKSLSDTKIVVDGNGVHVVEDSTKNKILLISIVVIIFVVSIGLIAWVVIKENYYREEEIQVKRFPGQAEEFVAQNDKQETLLLVKDEIDTIESDIEEFYSLLNDKDANEYGVLLIK